MRTNVHCRPLKRSLESPGTCARIEGGVNQKDRAARATSAVTFRISPKRPPAAKADILMTSLYQLQKQILCARIGRCDLERLEGLLLGVGFLPGLRQRFAEIGMRPTAGEGAPRERH